MTQTSTQWVLEYKKMAIPAQRSIRHHHIYHKMAIELGDMPSECPKVNFVSYKESFDKAVGSNPHARLLLRTKDGQQLFHEAGIYLNDEQAVVLSSNRMHASCGQQSIRIVEIPLQAIPKHEHNVKQSHATTSLDDKQQQELWSSIKIHKDLPSPLVMPNGACRWKKADGTDAVLWCEQGRHNMNARSGCSSDLHSAMVSYDLDGRCNVELDNYKGKYFSSLNDAVLHDATGAVFFTDPDYGVEQLYKRCWSQETYAPNGVYCWQPRTGQVQLLDTAFVKPNGCTFLPDPTQPIESGRGLLLVTETGRLRFDHRTGEDGKLQAVFIEDESKPACFYSYPVGCSNSSEEGLPSVDTSRRKLVAHSTSGAPDGIHVDELGNVWAGHGDGVHVYDMDWDAALSTDMTDSPCGSLIGKITLPNNHGVANFCWAGKAEDEGYRLLVFAEDELWEVTVAVNGRD